MPKSSIEMRTPIAVTSSSSRREVSGSSMTLLSVISSTSRSAGNAAAASRARRRCGNSACSRSRAERLTAMARSRPSRRQAAACAKACSSTQPVISRIAPVRSATAMNSAGRHGPSRGCVPAQQHLGLVDPAGREVELGLKGEAELAARDGAPEVSRQAQPFDAVPVLRRVVEGGTEVALLGGVHRDLGAPQQGRRIAAVIGIEGDSEARGDVDAHLLDLHRAGERGFDLGERRARLGEPARRQQEREFVAAEAGDRELAAAGDLLAAAAPARAGGDRRHDGRACR